MADHEAFECAIRAQGRFQFVVPVVAAVVSIIVAVGIGVLGRQVKLPETLLNSAATVICLAGVGIAVWYGLAAQGKLVMSREELVVTPLWRKPIPVRLVGVQHETLLWIRQATGSLKPVPVGPIIELDDGTRQVTIGTGAPDLARQLMPGEGSRVSLSPSFVVDPGDFRQIAERLGVALAES